MMEEYQSIMKNDVWEIVPRPEGKSIVTSKWVYKINMQYMGVSINTRKDSWLEGSPSRREKTMMRHFLQFPDTPLLEPSYLLQHPWVGFYIRWM
jgi:hypothetical protein